MQSDNSRRAPIAQQPIAVIADHECPNCGATSHHRPRVERTSPALPAECRAHLAASVIRGLGGTVTR